MPVYQSSRPATKNYHRLGGLNNSDFLSPGSRGGKSQIKVSAGLVPSEASHFSACRHVS